MTEFAIIDIGSNSVRFAYETGGVLSNKEVYTTRLGAGLAQTGMLSQESMDKSFAVIARLVGRARAAGLVPAAYATSAVRDAHNGRAFAARLNDSLGLPVRILTGEEEARFAFDAAGEGCSVMMDVGGASMQLVTRDLAVSFPAGCVRCGDIARFVTGAGLPDEMRPMQSAAVGGYVYALLRDVPPVSGRAVGVGGTITTLAALEAGLREFDPQAVSRTKLTQSGVRRLISKLESMGGEGRKKHPLLTERHDVILCGADVVLAAMKKLGMDELSVSCADGMEGYLYEMRRTHGA